MVASVAPKKYRMGSRKMSEMLPNTTALTTHRMVTLPRMSSAPCTSFCPRRMDESVAPPTPTSVLKAISRFISGKLMARAVMARAPTPWPMKILSMMLYNEVSVMPMMAGMEYCHSSFPIGASPSTCGLFAFILCILSLKLRCKVRKMDEYFGNLCC